MLASSDVEGAVVQKGLLIKALLIATLFALLQIPLRMIDGIVAERSARQQAVVREIASASYGSQLVAAPILSLPYVEEFDETVIDERARRVERRRIERVARMFPATSTLDAYVAIETKSRGLFSVRVFAWHAVARGEFALDGTLELDRTRADSRLVFGKPTLSLLLADPRGLIGTPTLTWDGAPMAFERGSALERAASGLHADVPTFDPAKPQQIGYSVGVALHRTQSLSIVPLANDDRTSLRSDWPHPSFGGQFLPLPESQRRSAEGFSAQWPSPRLRRMRSSRSSRSSTASRRARNRCAPTGSTCASSIGSTSIRCPIAH